MFSVVYEQGTNKTNVYCITANVSMIKTRLVVLDISNILANEFFRQVNRIPTIKIAIIKASKSFCVAKTIQNGHFRA